VLVLQLTQNQKRTVGADSPIISEMRAGEIRKFLHSSNLDREQVVDITRELRALSDLWTTAHLPLKGSHIIAAGVHERDLDERLDCEPDSLGIEQRRVGTDDAGLLQPTHPAHARGSRYP